MGIIRAVFAALLLTLAAGQAMADPTGTFRVEGTNPGTGDEYKGTVTVTRTGNTYHVIWDIGGTTYTGTGLGASFTDGSLLVGEAQSDDTVISVGYSAGNSSGTALYVEQEDGSWTGAWSYSGGDDIGYEYWYPN
ncbi:MAG: hypothetical protein R3D43_12950 [Tepidamorphaceae bacterium]|nr:hypothetical protein [Rhodobiaceae bacterium]MCC0049987.1 hypothetical protein [Rhodobiaceae bacterium]